MRILLWHVHGSWADAFVHGDHEYLLPTLPEGGAWGLGRAGRDWPESVREVHPDHLRAAGVDVVLLQRPEEMAVAERLLGGRLGRDVPAVFVEHNTPKGDVPNTVHPLAGQSEIPIVHVTHFNELMWDNGEAPTTVVEHGIRDPGYRYTGELERLAFVTNEPVRRWRVTGTDLLPGFTAAAPVDVFGMKADGVAEALGLGDDRIAAVGDLGRESLHSEMARRRAYIHPVRWTSLGLSLLEAMHLGMPIIALAATEAIRAVPPAAGIISTNMSELYDAAHRLIADANEARRTGDEARAFALSHYGLDRFLTDWDRVLSGLLTSPSQPAPPAPVTKGERP